MVARRLLTAMAGALLFSSVVTFALSRHMAHARNPGGTMRLVAAARDVPAGQPIESSMLKLIDWPAGPAVRGSTAKPETLLNRVSMIPLVAGDLVLDQQLSAPGSANGLTRKIPPGQRAIALKSDEVAGVAGFLLPGSSVDVLVTSTGFGGNASTTTIVQDAPVLAAGQKTDPDPDGKPATATVVTLLVSPVDAEKLALASSSGKIHFVLRNEADRLQVANLAPELSVPAQPSGLNANANLAAKVTPAPSTGGGEKPVAKAAAKPRPDADAVEVIKGGRSSEPAFPGVHP